MTATKGLEAIILEIVDKNSDCDLEKLNARCPQATWNQVFIALDKLSRTGQVTLRQEGPGRYTVQLSPQKLSDNDRSLPH